MKIRESTIVVFDTETTGTDVETDRIVEIGAVKITAGEFGRPRCMVVNPGVQIPKEASDVHGIYDADVASAPGFKLVGAKFLDFISGADALCGYNAINFDVPIVDAELARAGIEPLSLPVVDPMVTIRWLHRGMRKRNLESACAHYGVRLENAHTASADAVATAQLLVAMVQAGDIEDDLTAALATQGGRAELIGEEFDRFSYWLYVERGSERVMMGAGKHCGRPLSTVPPGYLTYILGVSDDLTDETAELFKSATRCRA